MESRSPAAPPPDLLSQPGLGLITDLYELTMAQAYFQGGLAAPASFSLFVRRMPPQRPYLVAAGLEGALEFLAHLHFPPAAIDYLRSTGIFSGAFLDYLGGLRFTGDVWAVPEGRVIFANEPLMEVTAPVIEAQLVETFLINQMNLHTLLATKAARCVVAARGRAVVHFTLRRAQGIDAGLAAARAGWIAGFQGTSNVLAGQLYGIPVSGTMAHSFVTAFESETEAFRSFAASFPDRCILLIDTYDTLKGAEKAAIVAKEMEARGQRLQGVRLDSGDLLELSRDVRRILDDAGLGYVRIFASGGLDENEVDSLVAAGAPIDAFGVGTKFGVSGDAPWLDIAYKMVEFAGRPVLKLSPGKRSLPGRKQVFRQLEHGGLMLRDVITTRDDASQAGEPLLAEVMRNGEIRHHESLEQMRERCATELRRLPDELKALATTHEHPVEISDGLKELAGEVASKIEELSERELGES